MVCAIHQEVSLFSNIVKPLTRHRAEAGSPLARKHLPSSGKLRLVGGFLGLDLSLHRFTAHNHARRTGGVHPIALPSPSNSYLMNQCRLHPYISNGRLFCTITARILGSLSMECRRPIARYWLLWIRERCRPTEHWRRKPGSCPRSNNIHSIPSPRSSRRSPTRSLT